MLISAFGVTVAVSVRVPPCAILPPVMPIGYSTVSSVEISALSTVNAGVSNETELSVESVSISDGSSAAIITECLPVAGAA